MRTSHVDRRYDALYARDDDRNAPAADVPPSARALRRQVRSCFLPHESYLLKLFFPESEATTLLTTGDGARSISGTNSNLDGTATQGAELTTWDTSRGDRKPRRSLSCSEAVAEPASCPHCAVLLRGQSSVF